MVHRAFWAGMIVFIAVQSLMQDLIGKEEYLRRVAATWWPWYISVPIAVMLVFMGMGMLNESRREEKS